MEIYKTDSAPVVSLKIPVIPTGTTVDAKAVINGEVLYDFPTVAFADSSLRVTLPYSLLKYDRDFYIQWEFNYLDGVQNILAKDTTLVQVVTPILPLEEIKSISSLNDNNQAKDLERKVRGAIQAFTGQVFGRYLGTLVVRNQGYPMPLLEVHDEVIQVTGTLGIKHAMFDHDKFIAPIYAPPVKKPRIIERVITGVWGYWEVPENVKQAARMLANDYACDESLYRDRYIKTMDSNDYRYEFSPATFSGTGNVQADQLLMEYRQKRMAVI